MKATEVNSFENFENIENFNLSDRLGTFEILSTKTF